MLRRHSRWLSCGVCLYDTQHDEMVCMDQATDRHDMMVHDDDGGDVFVRLEILTHVRRIRDEVFLANVPHGVCLSLLNRNLGLESVEGPPVLHHDVSHANGLCLAGSKKSSGTGQKEIPSTAST